MLGLGGRRVLLAGLVLTAALPGSASAQPASLSQGAPHDGRLSDGFELPPEGAHYRLYGPVMERGTQWATVETAALVGRGARAVFEATGGAPLVVGDCSLEHGGATPRHASHRSGRDVDLLFYVLDRRGASVASRGFTPFDGAGRCLADGCTLTLDVVRTWWLVRTLLASRRPAVQYVFVSEPLRALLLEHAARAQEHPALLRRARRILRQPGDAAAHDDHLHVRVYCASDDRAAGCVDVGPRWPWVGADGRATPLRAQPRVGRTRRRTPGPTDRTPRSQLPVTGQRPTP